MSSKSSTKAERRSERRQMGERVAIPRVSWTLSEGGANSTAPVVTRRLGLPSVALAGAANYTLTANQAGSATDWSTIAAAFQSVRVLAVRINWVAAATGTNGYYAVCTFRNGTTIPAGPAAIWVGERPRLFNGDFTTPAPLKYEVRATGAGDCEWVPTSTVTQPTGDFGIRMYNGSVACTIFPEMVVQFRSNN